MSAKRLDLGLDDTWKHRALMYYRDGHTAAETYAYVRAQFPVSDRVFRSWLHASGECRGVSGAQALKRFDCVCVECKQPFRGRTPTVLMCDPCVGEDCKGVTPLRMKRYQYFRRINSYGISIHEYESMLLKQENRCGLCTDMMKSPCVDHDHKTNVVRGLLCHRCNLTLGHVEQAGGLSWLMKASTWIQQGKGQ